MKNAKVVERSEDRLVELTTRVPVFMRTQLRVLAAQSGMSQQGIVQAALADWMTQNPAAN